ncbi:MFS transporter [Thermoactinospora rubra]|uniref:MFS transporter n=1 Tax=Thermoactinospora rubra TaxID=1088767 RepID=UPI001180E340|nr:MFS transporter [Thermoactinospora rubra]
MHGTTAGQRRIGGLLWQRDFRLFWFGETVSEIGNSLAVVAMSLLVVAELKASTFQVSLLTAAAFLPWLLVSLPAGAWVDRLPSRKVMIVSDVVSFALYASIPLAAWLGVLTFEHVLLVALLAGAANVFFDTAYQVQLPVLVDAGDLVEGNVKMQASISAARLGGSSAGGFAVQAMGAATALMVNAASFLVSVACLLGIRRSDPPGAGHARAADPVEGGLWRTIAEGLRFVARDRYFRPLTIWASVSNFGLTGYDALIVVFLVRDVGVQPNVVGLLMAVAGVGAVLGSLVAGRVVDRFGTARGLLAMAVFVIPLVLLIPLASPGPGLALYAAGILMCVTGIAVTNVIAASFRQAYAPPGMLGRVTATTRFLLNGVYIPGALVAGGLGTWLGVRATLWIMLGMVALAGVFLFTPALLGRRDLPQQAR